MERIYANRLLIGTVAIVLVLAVLFAVLQGGLPL